MAKIRQPVAPFGDVNVIPKESYIEVVASVLMVPTIEGAQVGIALDASARCQSAYQSPATDGSIFAEVEATNSTEAVTRTLLKYLTEFAGDGKVEVVYYSCGNDGQEIEKIATVDEASCAQIAITGPKQWGGQSKLLPGVKYFVDSMASNKWSFVIFVTDGGFDDLERVKNYCFGLGEDIAAGKREFIKLALLGVGQETNEDKMTELDDMFEERQLLDPQGNEIDLWCHQWLKDMQRVEEIFAEIASENTIVAPQGRILDQDRNEIKFYPDGLPSKVRFQLPAKSTAFTIKYPGGEITQDITSVL